MPRFYFDICDDGDLQRDEVGDTLDTDAAAEALGNMLLADLVRDAPAAPAGQDVCCEVRDEAGRIVYRGELTFRSFRL